MAEATLFTEDGDVADVEPTDGDYFTLEELQRLIGGLIETKYLMSQDKYLIFHEEGKLLDLPLNDLATAIYQREYGPVDVIVGPALLCSKEYLR